MSVIIGHDIFPSNEKVIISNILETGAVPVDKMLYTLSCELLPSAKIFCPIISSPNKFEITSTTSLIKKHAQKSMHIQNIRVCPRALKSRARFRSIDGFYLHKIEKQIKYIYIEYGI